MVIIIFFCVPAPLYGSIFNIIFYGEITFFTSKKREKSSEEVEIMTFSNFHVQTIYFLSFDRVEKMQFG
jgi:hypothetical protein